MKQEKTINLKPSDYEQKGLYVLLKDSTKLVLTKENVEKTTMQYWKDANKISTDVKKVLEFQRCTICPLKGKDDLCDAIRPVLPFLDIVDKYVSFNEVMTIYKGEEKELFYVANTTMQEALKYISILSLMQYCQVGRKYYKYYNGIIPTSGGREATLRMYLNIYWMHKGNEEEVNKIIEEFIKEIRETSQNQVKRMNLICKNDVFMNAFVNTQIATEFLSMDIEKRLQKSFEEFEKA